MKLLGKLKPKAGYKVYPGADISALLTREIVYWACTAVMPTGVQANVIFVQQRDTLSGNINTTDVLIPLNTENKPLINARGSLGGYGIPNYVGWDKTDEKNPVAYLYELEEVSIPTSSGGQTFEPISVPSARWISDGTPYEITDELIRNKFTLTDTLLNALRAALIQHKLVK